MVLPSWTSIPMYIRPVPGSRWCEMSPEERQSMNRLCQRIQEERDSYAFDKLMKELNDLLESHRGESIATTHRARAD